MSYPSLTVDEFLDWHENHPMKERFGVPFPHGSRDLLEQMADEGYKFEIHDGAPYIRGPWDTSE